MQSAPSTPASTSSPAAPRETLDAWVREIVDWHFDPATGSPFWLEFARKAGCPAPLAVGMFQAGVLNAWATDWLGPENVRRTRIRWKEQVWPGDVLTFTGKIARLYEENGESKVDLELETHLLNEGAALLQPARDNAGKRGAPMSREVQPPVLKSRPARSLSPCASRNRKVTACKKSPGLLNRPRI